jgi:hypothetical protein
MEQKEYQKEYLPKPLVAYAMEFTGGRENAWAIMDWARKDGYQAQWRDAGTAQTVTIDRGDDYIVMHLGDFLVRTWDALFFHHVAPEFHKRYMEK